jgi:hypothetical protein
MISVLLTMVALATFGGALRLAREAGLPKEEGDSLRGEAAAAGSESWWQSETRYLSLRPFASAGPLTRNTAMLAQMTASRKDFWDTILSDGTNFIHNGDCSKYFIGPCLEIIFLDYIWISRFHPRYKMLDRSPTSVKTLQRAQKIGMDAGLR